MVPYRAYDKERISNRDRLCARMQLNLSRALAYQRGAAVRVLARMPLRPQDNVARFLVRRAKGCT